jgi:NTP pyrophosphatase (non-canonical NTP hydrolase)
MNYSLDELAEEIHFTAVDKGFWPEDVDDIFIAKQCMMIVSEVTEAMEAVRKDKGSMEVVEELADIIVRTLDLWKGMHDNGYVGHSLDYTLQEKIEKNKDRPERHGVRF